MLRFRRGLKTLHNEVRFANEARMAVLQGAHELYKAVSVTLGPKGRNVLIEQKYNSVPKITKDGFSIAQELRLRDKYQDLGCQLLKRIASKSNNESGDGTTTSTVLAYSILSETLKHVATGANPQELRRGVELAVEAVVRFLGARKTAISGEDLAQIRSIALVSSNGDHSLAQLLTQALSQVGADGSVSIEAGKTIRDEIVVSKGMRFPNGYISSQFGSAAGKKTTLVDPLVLLFKGDLSNAQHILPSLSYARRLKKPLLIVTQDLRGDALAITLLNKLKGQVDVVPVKIPGFGENRYEYLLDLEALTGATMVDPFVPEGVAEGVAHGRAPVASAATRHVYGSASSVVVSATETIINKSSRIDESKIAERVEGIKQSLANPDLSVGDREQLYERLSKLTGASAIIRPGGTSTFEVKEKFDRLEDALSSTQIAIKGGILPGGGVALLKASLELANQHHLFANESFDTQLGVAIVKKALAAPFDKILANSGIDADPLKAQLLTHGTSDRDFQAGIDARTAKLGDMYEMGIIDPFLTVKNSLINAAGVTTLLSTTEVAITTVEAEKEGF